jgi:glycerophosphoryl diester phosphodiesterase
LNRQVLPSWSRERLLNIGHRGARGLAPENTLEAIAKAKTAGADMVEIDVHLSSDNIPIVVHDDTLTEHPDVQVRYPDRAPWFVSHFTAAEITSLDAGRVHPPRLREALELAKTVGLLVNVELKALPRRYPGLARIVVDAVKELELVDNVLLSSFDHEELLAVRQMDDRIATAVLTRDRLAEPVRYVRDVCRADALHPGCSGDSDSVGLDSISGAIDRATISALRDAGLLVNVWTENDPVRMSALIGAGVTGIVTDYPDRLARILGSA